MRFLKALSLSLLLSLSVASLTGCGNNNIISEKVSKLEKGLEELTDRLNRLVGLHNASLNEADRSFRFRQEKEREKQEEMVQRLIKMSGNRQTTVSTAIQIFMAARDNGLYGTPANLGAEFGRLQWALYKVFGGEHRKNAFVALKNGFWGGGAEQFTLLFTAAKPVTMFFMPEYYREWLKGSRAVLEANPSSWHELGKTFLEWAGCNRLDYEEECRKIEGQIAHALGQEQKSKH